MSNVDIICTFYMQKRLRSNEKGWKGQGNNNRIYEKVKSLYDVGGVCAVYLLSLTLTTIKDGEPCNRKYFVINIDLMIGVFTLRIP